MSHALYFFENQQFITVYESTLNLYTDTKLLKQTGGKSGATLGMVTFNKKDKQTHGQLTIRNVNIRVLFCFHARLLNDRFRCVCLSMRTFVCLYVEIGLDMSVRLSVFCPPGFLKALIINVVVDHL